MTKLYVSGPMKGIEDSNFTAFEYAGRMLREVGYEVENPIDNGLERGLPWETYLRADLAMVVKCDGVALLPDWEMSSGAHLEVHVARALNMPVRTLDRWMEAALS